jgi:hypothetical protein
VLRACILSHSAAVAAHVSSTLAQRPRPTPPVADLSQTVAVYSPDAQGQQMNPQSSQLSQAPPGGSPGGEPGSRISGKHSQVSFALNDSTGADSLAGENELPPRLAQVPPETQKR